MNDDRASGLVDRCQYGVLIPWRYCPQIDDLGRDPVLFQLGRCCQATGDHFGIADQGHVGAFVREAGLTEGDRDRVHRYVPRNAIGARGFDEDARVGVGDAREHQPLGIGRIRRRDNFQSGCMREPRFEEVAVLPAARDAGTRHHTDDDGNRGLHPRHVTQFGGMVDDHVHADRGEIHQHDFGDGLVAVDGGADRRADNGLFRNRGGFDPVVAEAGGQSLGHPDDAAAFAVGDVFAEHQNRGVGIHCLDQGLINRLNEIQFFGFNRHQAAPASA